LPKQFTSTRVSGRQIVFFRPLGGATRAAVGGACRKSDFVREMDGKLHNASRALDKKNRDFAQLNEALR